MWHNHPTTIVFGIYGRRLSFHQPGLVAYLLSCEMKQIKQYIELQHLLVDILI